MKVTLLVLLFFVGLGQLRADQLELLSEEDAKRAVEFIQKQKEVVLWCGCCTKQPKQIVKVSKVSYAYDTLSEPYMGVRLYKVTLEAVEYNGQVFYVGLDLAYVHIKKGRKSISVGSALKMKCVPCTRGFKWKPVRKRELRRLEKLARAEAKRSKIKRKYWIE